MKVLILASNPRKDLNLDREIRDLREVIERSHNHQDFQVEDALAVRVSDLQQLLFKYEPQIVHFCGHGSGQQGLVFQDNDEKEKWVATDALSELFRLFSSGVECVLLNACYSEIQANSIVNHINYVIGMNQEIQDNAAIAFSKGFYQALGDNRSIEQAFEFGCNAIQLEISGSSRVRSTKTNLHRKIEIVDVIEQTAIPEHLKPILKVKPALSSKAKENRSFDSQVLPDKVRTEIQLAIDKSLRHTPKVHSFFERGDSLLSEENLLAPKSEYTSSSFMSWLFREMSLPLETRLYRFKWGWINGTAWAIGGAATTGFAAVVMPSAWDIGNFNPVGFDPASMAFYGALGAVGGAVGGAVASLMQLSLTPISNWWWWFKGNTLSWAGACFLGGALWGSGIFEVNRNVLGCSGGLGIGLGFALIQGWWFRKKIPMSRFRFWGIF